MAPLTVADLTVLPWTREARDYVAGRGYTLQDFASPKLAPILQRAAQKVREASDFNK
ncbi:hypothetical protein [Candidatus Hecatella orcuttiae]|jgi:hypothetical protein|uniref:hypothetical protein n=1 Tax=Candidatus Hecatella orcuttiae TaxID=1935119 RepID=UPI002867F42E|nr:hypothetical protein [Candidatus Hecatella orcuttiae]